MRAERVDPRYQPVARLVRPLAKKPLANAIGGGRASPRDYDMYTSYAVPGTVLREYEAMLLTMYQ